METSCKVSFVAVTACFLLGDRDIEVYGCCDCWGDSPTTSCFGDGGSAVFALLLREEEEEEGEVCAALRAEALAPTLAFVKGATAAGLGAFLPRIKRREFRSVPDDDMGWPMYC